MPVGRRHLLRLHRLLVRSAAGGHLVGVRGRVGVRVRVRARVRVRVRARVRVRIRIRVRVRVRIRVRVGVRVRVRVGVRVRAAGRHRGHPEPLFVPKVVEAIPRRLAIHRYTYMYMDSIFYSYIWTSTPPPRIYMRTFACVAVPCIRVPCIQVPGIPYYILYMRRLAVAERDAAWRVDLGRPVRTGGPG